MRSEAPLSGESVTIEPDLGPLAWVLDELRKSLEGATMALKRFVRDAELSRGSDLAALDASHLRIARQQLHQAVGALEMVGQEVPAKMLRAMEALAQKFVQRPEFCSDEAALKVERASFALTDYLEGLLKGRSSSSVALFPQYRDVLDLLADDRIHPADLWAHDWRWLPVHVPATVQPLGYDSAVRSRIDGFVLNVVKTAHVPSAQAMADISWAFAAAQKSLHPRVFWATSSAYFEAVALGLCAADVYTKRAASRVLSQYRTLARGEPDVSERLVQDLLFFCAQAAPAAGQPAPALRAVRQAYGLTLSKPVDYVKPQFGLFDPAVLVQARKRIASLTETWSALSGGDTQRIKTAADQFGLVTESIVKLHPQGRELAVALTRAMDTVSRSGRAPSPPLAMEVATAVLFLEAAYDDMDPTSEQMAQRSQSLAKRLDHVIDQGQSEPLDGWMEDLYRRVSDRQIMGSVVDELRTTLSEVESSLDAFFRRPDEKLPLQEVPGKLAVMRGVFSVLGLEQAALATLRMRDRVEQCLLSDHNGQVAQSGVFEKIGNSLGALGFLIDMLNYQRELAKKLFVYDEDLGEFRSLMGRSKAPDQEPPPEADQSAIDLAMQTESLPVVAELALMSIPVATQEPERTLDAASDLAQPGASAMSLPNVSPAPAARAVAPPAPVDDEDDDAELRSIFLEEAREVVSTGMEALVALQKNPADLEQQAALRRAYHTLKGSSRMVGLAEFGEAAWAMEQLLNAWLPQQQAASAALIKLSGQAVTAFGQWVDDIAVAQDARWSAQPFRKAADLLRLDNVGSDLLTVPAVTATEVSTVPKVDAAPEALVVARVPELADALEVSEAPELAQAPVVADAIPQASPDLLDAGLFDLGDTESEPSQPMSPMPPDAEPPMVVSVPEPAAAIGEGALDELDADFASGPPADFGDTQLLDNMWSPVEASMKALDDALTKTATPDLAEFDFGTEALQQASSSPAQESAAEAEAEAEAGLDIAAGIGLAPDVSSEREAEIELDFGPETRTGSEAEVELDLDFESEPEAALPVAPESTAVHEPLSELELDFDPVPEFELTLDEESDAEDQVKVIGSLRIGIPLYNVYLNEADEWSRRLLTELAEWSLELNEPLPDSPISLAHSLAGSSATVGFMALSDLSRMLEHALSHVQLAGVGLPEHAELFVAVAEDIRRLLHQFAAGFLKQPDPELIPALKALLDIDFSALVPEPLSEPELADAVSSQAGDLALDNLLSVEVEQSHEAALPIAAVVAAPQAPAPALTQEAALGDELADEEIDAQDVLDVDLFPIFEEEALELLPQLSAALRQWGAHPDNVAARQAALRVLHTLKGSARLAGAMRLGEMAHRMESAAERIDPETATADALDPLLARLDNISTVFEALRATPEQALALPEAPAEAAAPLAALVAAPDAAEPLVSVWAPVSSVGATSPMLPLRRSAGPTIRIRSQVLDRMVTQAGEVIITRARLESRLGQLRGSLNELTSNLDRLRRQLRDIELQSESQMQSRLAQTKDSAKGFDPLEFDRFTRVQELTRMMAESVHDVATLQRTLQQTVAGVEDDLIAQARQTRELQRDLLRTRMVEFESISERLYGVVRQAAKDAGKQVKLEIVGGSLELDRGVLDRVAPAFEHLLRNAVAHGIEAPALRSAAGKPPTGTIVITLEQQSNDVAVTFHDDGAGLNLPRIRDKALAQHLISAEDTLTDAQLANLIFASGLSTNTQVSELSGRGIGMDVVRNEVNALGGRIELSTQSGSGTQFKLVLPLTTAVTQVVLLRIGDAVMGVPSNLVELVRRVPASELAGAYRAAGFNYNGEALPFYWAGALLQASKASAEPPAKNASVAIFRSAGRRVALHVDEVLGNQEVVVKNLGPQLSRLPGLAGMSVLASGAVVLIYNPVALHVSYGEQSRAFSVAASAPVAGVPAVSALVPLVLVVDDSITVRRVTQRLLKREGFRVALASDGLNALEVLQSETPSVVLTDIEMPRMDGFDLVRNIRGDARWRDLPIIMITSRIAEKHRDYAKELKVDHYLGKPYPEDVLIALVRQYCEADIQA